MSFCLINLFTVYITTLSIAQMNEGMIVNNEQERIWKKVAVI